MNNKKVQAQMQLNVSFVADTATLVKKLESSLDKIKIGSNLTKQFEADIDKGFKELFNNLNKMSEGLSKKGLNVKQYNEFFTSINAKVQDSTKFLTGLQKKFNELYNSEDNKRAVKELENYKKQILEINKALTAQKAAQTRRNTAVDKLRSETGIEYGLSKRMLKNISERKGSGQQLTANQKAWLGDNEDKLKRILELYKQILAQDKKISDGNLLGKQTTGQATLEKSQEHLRNNITKGENNAISEAQFKRISASFAAIEPEVAKTTSSIENFDNVYNNNVMPQAIANAERMAQSQNTLNEVLAQFGLGFSLAHIINQFKELIKYSFDFYTSLDSALNEIYVVSGLSSASVQGLKNDFINMAKETGMAIDDVTQSAVLFYQQGLSTSEVLQMTKVTSQFAKVAGIDATDAADKLTAAVNGYCLAAEDAASVADKFNKVAAVSAADINELSTAFSKAAAQANQAGISMDNYLAYIATMEEATREAPENIGTSLKTIFSRMQQIKTGENTEDDTDVNNVETALKSVGIALRDTQGELRDLEEIFDELGPKWNSLDRNTQAYLGTIIAGTRQQSRFVSLMQNWDRVMELSEESANSAGQQALMHAKAMDSIESKLKQLTVAWQEFVSSLGNSSLFKGVISALTNVLNILSKGKTPITVLTIAVGLLGKKMAELQAPLLNKGKEFAVSFGLLKNTTRFSSESSKNAAVEGAYKAMVDNQSAINKLKAEELSIQQQISELENKDTQNSKEQEENQQKINALKDQETAIQKNITNAEDKQTTLEKNYTKNKNGIVSSGSKGWASGLKSLGIGVQTMSALVSQTDEIAGGLMSSVGGLASGVGQIASGQWISGAITIMTSLWQVVDTFKNKAEIMAEKLDNASKAIGDKLEEIEVNTAQLKSVDNLTKKYETLSRKINKSIKEQNDLNEAAQQLAEALEIDTYEDSYGNITVNLEEAKEATEALTEKTKDLADELKKTEINSLNDATSGWLNDNTISDAIKKNFSDNSNAYKSLINTLDDKLDGSVRNVSDNVAKNFSTHLKNSIYKYVSANSSDYIAEGFGNAMTRISNEINTDKLDASEWNDLYSAMDYLQQNMNDMSFQDAQNYLDNFYDNWSGKNDIALEDWEILRDSINNTVFENSSLMNFYNEAHTLANKANGSYYDSKIKKINSQIEATKKQTNIFEENVGTTSILGGIAGGAAVGTAGGALAGTPVLPGVGTAAGAIGGFIIGAVGGGIAAYKASNTEDAKTLKALKKQSKELQKEKDEFLEQYAKDNAIISSAGKSRKEAAEIYINAMNDLSETFAGMKQEDASFFNGINSFQNLEGLTAEQAKSFSEQVKDLVENQKYDFSGSDGADYDALRDYYMDHIDEIGKDPAVKEKWQQALDEAWSNLKVSTPVSLKQIGTELKDMSTDLVKMNDIIADFKDNGGMALDTFIELGEIIDKINLDDLSAIDPSAIDNYINAIDQLNLAYDANSGYITMNGEALQSLQQIQELQTKSKIAGMIADLKASKATIETGLAYIDAQIAGTDAAIAAAEMSSSATTTADEIKGQADAAYSNFFDEAIGQITDAYQNDVDNQSSWVKATLENLNTAKEAWSKYFTAVRNGSNGEDISGVKIDAQSKTKNIEWEGKNAKSGIDWNNYSGTIEKGSEKQEQLLADLKNYREKLVNSRKEQQALLELNTQEINLLNNMYNSDLSKLGRDGKDSGDKLEQYIGQLLKINNILNRISNLKGQLDLFEEFGNIATGEQYGKTLAKQIDYTKELADQNLRLTEERAKEANSYKEFIQNVEGLEGVFDFDDFGQIIINWEKYNSLQDTTAKGEVSLKQKADDVYNTYTEMFQYKIDAAKEYLTYLDQTIKKERQQIDAYLDVEDKAASAIKEIYQKILDTKLDAIDKEKEAIEDLRKAREQARKDQENAKAITGLQTNLQRAMMDTSGASDSSLIKAQADLDDKLNEIAEDKYSQELDDIIQSLEAEADSLQNNFDELFENQQWLFESLEANFMDNKERLEKLWEQTDEWNKDSPTRQADLLKELDTKYETYTAALKDGKTIKDLYEEMSANEREVVKGYEAITSQLTTEGGKIQQTILSWQKDVTNAISSAVSKATSSSGGGGTSYKSGTGNTSNYYNKDNVNSKVNTYSITLDDGYKSCSVKTVTAGQSITLPALTRSGYKFIGWDIPSLGLCTNGSHTYKPTRSETVKAMWTATSSKVTFNTNTTLAAYDKKTFLQAGRVHANGGLADYTGPAWLDGTKSKPEAVLNALQTQHFIDFTDTLDKMYSGVGTTNTSSSVSIDNIQFNVESMSSVEDGEKAFNTFVDKFKEIGNQTGLKIGSFKNTL